MIIMLSRVNYDFPNAMPVPMMSLIKSFTGIRNRLSLHELRTSTKNGDDFHSAPNRSVLAKRRNSNPLAKT